ncbi:MAG TPA: SMP-30/gluconolactonase/LRE family protein [Metabacillus sp.]|nr:SMP-30/gluconolactonase/LRE family protein [Metabacillus sp.]
MAYQAELVVHQKAILGEGPHWDGHVLYWVDIMSKRLHRYNPEQHHNETFQLDQYIGAVIPSLNGQLVVGLQNGIHALDLQSGSLTLIGDPETELPHNRFNDGKCDPSGRLYIGTMDVNAERGKGSLYRLDLSGQLKKMISPVTISNGLAWSPDEKFMYFIDTPTGEVSTFTYDKQTGDIVFKETAVRIPNEMGSPDGMTIDQEGMIWVAHWGGSRVTRWDPHIGKQLDEVHVPAPNVTSCTFGGQNLDELYITTARQGLTEEELALSPQAGGLFKVKTKVKGMVGQVYRGNI